MPEHRLISELVDLVAEKQLAEPSKSGPYVGLEHIPERAIKIGPIGDISNIRGMCVRFREGDILFGKLRPNLRKCVRAPVDGLGSTEILVLRSKPETDPDFAAHVLRSEGVFIVAERMTEGTRMPRTSWKTLSGVQVFAPDDGATQKLIADILDAIDDTIIETDVLLKKFTVLRLGLVEDLCSFAGDSGFEPSSYDAQGAGWELGELGYWLTTIEQGWSPDCSDERTPYETWGVLKTTSVVWAGWDDTQNKRLPDGVVPKPALEVSVGDVLMTRAGPDHRVGVVACVNRTQGKLMLSDKLYRLVPTPELNPEFLALALSTDDLQRQISSFKSGMAQSQMNISQAAVRKLRFAKPSIDYQEQTVEKVGALDNRIAVEKTKLVKLNSLRTALRDDLLTGRVPLLAFTEAAE